MFEILYIVATFVLMLSTTIMVNIKQLKRQFTHPKKIVIGLICQYGLLPAIAFGLTQIFRFDDISSISLILTAICPGNVFSNIFSFISNADFDLSIAMTTISSTFSLGAIPINCIFYITILIDYDQLLIDYITISLFIASIICGFIFGSIIAYFRNTMIRQICSVFGAISTIFIIIFVIYSIISISFNGYSWQYYIATLCLVICGWIISFLLSLLCKLKRSSAVSIGIEISSQNTMIAVAILTLNTLNVSDHDDDIWRKSVFIPMIYPLFALIINVVLVSTFYCVGWTDLESKDENLDNSSLTLPVILRHYKKYNKMYEEKEQREFCEESDEEYIIELEKKDDAPMDRTISVQVGVTMTYNESF